MLRAQDGGGGCCLGHLALKPRRASSRGLNFVATDRSEPYVLNKHIALGTSAVVDCSHPCTVISRLLPVAACCCLLACIAAGIPRARRIRNEHLIRWRQTLSCNTRCSRRRLQEASVRDAPCGCTAKRRLSLTATSQEMTASHSPAGGVLCATDGSAATVGEHILARRLHPMVKGPSVSRVFQSVEREKAAVLLQSSVPPFLVRRTSTAISQTVREVQAHSTHRWHRCRLSR